MPTPYELLRDPFGFQSFRPGQEAVMAHLIAGRSAAAVFPTGSGKSLCYQLPALFWDGVTVVVSPLIALMKEQIDRLQARGIAAERIDSTLSAEETARIANALRAGQLRLLYVAPERFNNERFRETLQRVKVSLFAIDEAHCISEWGHNFRPDYLKLAHFSQVCGAERVLALTATATPQVLEDICRCFRIDPHCAVRTGFYRPNLTVRTTPMDGQARDAALLERLKARPPGTTIVYVTLQRTAESVASCLARAGLPARAYHAGMKTEDRTEVQEWFAGSDEAIVVATIAFGMGIDKADIRGVYHYNLPKSQENFSQEIGRAGRDGQPSVCETFVCAEDLNALENFVYGDTPSLDSLLGLVREIFAQPEEFSVSLYDLAGNHDIRQLVVNTLLTYLELDGYLEEGTPYYSRYRFRPLASSKEILARFEGQRKEFLAQVFRLARKAEIWFDIDVDSAAEATASPRERVVRALDYLAEKNLLELKVEGVRQRYRRLKRPSSVDELARVLHERTQQREKREIARLQQVMELIAHDGCQVSHLGEHFGEPLPAPCGHCSWCLDGQQPKQVPSRQHSDLDPTLWEHAVAVRGEYAEALSDARAFARFLCGLSSPRLTRHKLTRHDLFGVFDRVPFLEVLRRAQA